jgi:hypothetical protein
LQHISPNALSESSPPFYFSTSPENAHRLGLEPSQEIIPDVHFMGTLGTKELCHRKLVFCGRSDDGNQPAKLTQTYKPTFMVTSTPPGMLHGEETSDMPDALISRIKPTYVYACTTEACHRKIGSSYVAGLSPVGSENCFEVYSTAFKAEMDNIAMLLSQKMDDKALNNASRVKALFPNHASITTGFMLPYYEGQACFALGVRNRNAFDRAKLELATSRLLESLGLMADYEWANYYAGLVFAARSSIEVNSTISRILRKRAMHHFDKVAELDPHNLGANIRSRTPTEILLSFTGYMEQ